MSNEIDMVKLAEEICTPYIRDYGKEHAPKEVLRIHYGNKVGDRTGSVIVASIKTANMTLNEMGLILGAITDRICQVMREYPELEETAHDLAQTCEEYSEAQDKIDERLARQYPEKEQA